MVKINFMGDVMFGELLENYRCGLMTTLEKEKVNPFEHVSRVLEKGDFNVINLECVFSDSSTHVEPFSHILISPEKHVKLLSDNKVNIVNTANNHALDHGKAAFVRSLELMRYLGIRVIGYTGNEFFQSKPVVVEKGGRTIGFLGYNISNFPDDDKRKVVDRIKEVATVAHDFVDTVVISIHWGEEYTNIPPPHTIQFGRELLDAGCDILHGHHSHQIQGVVNDGRRLFAPSLGNFIFDQKIHQNRITAILQVAIGDDGLSHEYLPCYMNDRYQPKRSPGYDTYIEEINGYLKDSYGDGDEGKFSDRIDEKVRAGHRQNRLRMRVKMLSHFWDYLPYIRQILTYKGSTKKTFSVIDCEEGLPVDDPDRRS